MGVRGPSTILGILLAGFILQAHGITQVDFYPSFGKGDILRQGDSEFEMVKLEPPIPFYSQTYDHVYINTNGLLTFSGEFSNFINFPFPIEYPAIAPFYANVDSTRTEEYETGAISYFQSQDPEDVDQGTQLIRDHFDDAQDFVAQSIFVATWNNVGYFNQKSDLLNSFQVILIWSAEEAYTQFLYPQGGINWVQAEAGDSGLPDVRAQSGFVSEDGRFYLLRGSGTENVRFLTDYSNVNEPGRWLYRVGPLAYEENIVDPESVSKTSEEKQEETCATAGRMKCHVKSTCSDQPTDGFCCTCREGYYGNGYNCIKNDIPLRVTGSATGHVNSIELSAQFQSYVILLDGRSYSALSPLPAEIGPLFQLLPALGETVGWLFAKTGEGRLNGYQLTGGIFNQSTLLRFGSGEELRINYQFKGLNVWDQLTVDMEITGQLPELSLQSKVRVPDVVKTYVLEDNRHLNVAHDRVLEVPEQELSIPYLVNHEIAFDSCPFKPLDWVGNTMERVFKTAISYEPRDQALRVNMLNKVGDFESGVDPCNEGAICGENMVCVAAASAETGYECQCKNGYTLGGIHNGLAYCVDINECGSPSDNICDVNAVCLNTAGGYSCLCKSGFIGNGFECTESESVEPRRVEPSPEPRTSPPGTTPTPLAPSPYEEEECAPGDENCGYAPSEDLIEEEPVCDTEGCTCSPGFKVVEYGYSVKCERDESAASSEVPVNSRISTSDRVTCDVENNCHANANCEWTEEEQRFQCICVPGYDGDGYVCEEKPAVCYEDGNCDVHATCQYVLKVSARICVCDPGYVGDGRTCQLPPECQSDADCGLHSWCEEGLCSCRQGYERDLSDFCVPAGSCGGAYCAENAICQYDNVQQVSYCLCPKEFVGDGVHVCKSVPPPCNVRNNCGLNALCAPNYKDPSKYECQCLPGYYGDGYLCTLQVNCENTPSLCDRAAACVSSINGPICSCNSGYRGNGTLCTPVPKYENGFLLISQGVAVVRVPFDGSRGRPTSMSQMAISISEDCTTGRVYWSDISATCIYSANYDGTDKKIFTCDDIISPEGLAVDWISRRLYWTDSSKDIIEVASLDDPRNRAVLISTGLVNPRGIAVDPHANKLYWSDWNRESPKIESSNLDGTDREILLSDPVVKLPNSLDINPGTGEICYADAGTAKIGCYDSYARKARTVIPDLAYPFGLAITGDHFYWTDWTTRKIESADRNGIREAALAGPLFGNHKMYGMTAVTDTCTHYNSLCLNDNGGCPVDRLCLLNPRSPSGRACL